VAEDFRRRFDVPDLRISRGFKLGYEFLLGPMRTASDVFRELRIFEQTSRRGQFYTTCPECSPKRRKKRARCLSVKVDDQGVQFFCNHCPDRGGAFFDEVRFSMKREADARWDEANGRSRRRPRLAEGMRFGRDVAAFGALAVRRHVDGVLAGELAAGGDNR
jgi:hypothetical protein